MSFAASDHPADSLLTRSLKKTGSEAAAFGEGLFHGAVENPYNGAVQLANHAGHTNLPELHLADKFAVEHSFGGQSGTMIGTAADMLAASIATRKLGGPRYLPATARLTAIGAVDAGIFQPSDTHSKNFYADRATSAGVAAVTFSAMGAGAAGLDRLGVLAKGRSFGSVAGYSALAGAFGGVAHAEANAVLKENRALPHGKELVSDVGSYALFGVAFGAAGYAYDQSTSLAAVSHSRDADPYSQLKIFGNGTPHGYDSAGRINALTPTHVRADGEGFSAASIHYASGAKDAPVISARITTFGQPDIQVVKAVGRSGYDVYHGNDTTFVHNGDVKPVFTESGRAGLQFTNSQGRSFTYTPEWDYNFYDMARAHMTVDPGSHMTTSRRPE
jgi:hypothetical protein